MAAAFGFLFSVFSSSALFFLLLLFLFLGGRPGSSSPLPGLCAGRTSCHSKASPAQHLFFFLLSLPGSATPPSSLPLPLSAFFSLSFCSQQTLVRCYLLRFLHQPPADSWETLACEYLARTRKVGEQCLRRVMFREVSMNARKATDEQFVCLIWASGRISGL